MRLIKLDAIDSTNDFLKAMANNQPVENFTVVTAEHQTRGKGQMGAIWQSEEGKNLVMSVLINEALPEISKLFVLNYAVSLAVIEALQTFQIEDIAIKWPNDIMAGNKKIGGILIENNIKSDGSISAVVGIGLNVNQQDFERLPKATSLKLFSGAEFNRNDILEQIVKQLKIHIDLLANGYETMRQKYTGLLFKKDVPMPFENKATGERFMGMVVGIAEDGRLQIKRENDAIATYGLKQVEMLY